MMIFYPSRNAARNSLKTHKLVDNGTIAPSGKRYARDVSNENNIQTIMMINIKGMK